MGYDNRNNDNDDRRPYVGPAMEALHRHDKARFAILQFTEYERDKSSTVRLGTAFVNKDGSINLILEALPHTRFDRDGRPLPTSVQLRQDEPRDDRGGARR